MRVKVGKGSMSCVGVTGVFVMPAALVPNCWSVIHRKLPEQLSGRSLLHADVGKLCQYGKGGRLSEPAETYPMLHYTVSASRLVDQIIPSHLASGKGVMSRVDKTETYQDSCAIAGGEDCCSTLVFACHGLEQSQILVGLAIVSFAGETCRNEINAWSLTY